MVSPEHPELLAADWLPPLPVGRRVEIERLVGWLGDPLPEGPRPWGAVVVGPAGSGTSTLARLAARRILESARREGWTRPPVVVSVRVRWSRGTHAVATQLLQRLDEGFRGQGFPTTEILAGFLRRLRREARPAVVLLDDLGPGSPDVRPLIRALAQPDRFLPEGESGMPPLWTLLAGTPEPSGGWETAARAAFDDGHRIDLPPYTEAELRAIVDDRWRRAMGHPPGEADVRRLVTRSMAGGKGASRAMELLRRELLGSSPPSPTTGLASPGTTSALSVEPRVWEAIASAASTGPAALGEVRLWEERLAREQGIRPMPATTLWRRIVRLEAAGYLRREVRPGGAGGTRSRVELVLPPPPAVVARLTPSDTLRASGPADAGSPPAPREAWPVRWTPVPAAPSRGAPRIPGLSRNAPA